MLRSLIGYVRGAGLDGRWVVAEGDPEFFRITKRLHNRLHGVAGDGGPLADAERAAYERATRGARQFMPELSGAAAPAGRAAAALAAARSALGKPYVWGANGPSGFDCSGLMQWSYAQAGVSLPRTSQAQRYAGRQVPLSQAQPGDLVVYRSDASHVGMYVGNGQVIHAPYPGAPVRYDPVGMMPVASVTRV
jgi:hypothetical protein